MVTDIFNPLKTKLVKGIEGKIILVYGGNNLGKTMQGTRMAKPLVFPFESGLNASDNIPYLPVNNWADFRKWNAQITNPNNIEKAKETYQTIIFDHVEASARFCRDYIIMKHGATSIKSGNEGFGLWQEYEEEFWREINKLTSIGMTIYFIAHAEEDKNGQIRPKGDKRSIQPVMDMADIVLYLEPNGVDPETYQPINSKGYFVETPKFFARSRFPKIKPVLENFTAETLNEAISNAIDDQVEGGATAITFDEKKEIDSTTVDYDEIVEKLKEKFIFFKDNDRLDEYMRTIEETLGDGKKVSDIEPRQVELLKVTLAELESIE